MLHLQDRFQCCQQANLGDSHHLGLRHLYVAGLHALGFRLMPAASYILMQSDGQGLPTPDPGSLILHSCTLPHKLILPTAGPFQGVS